MDYKFRKYNLDVDDVPEPKRVYEFSVDYDQLKDAEKSLFHIGSHMWTEKRIQDLIDKSLSLKNDEEYEYKGDGSNLFMIIDKNEVFFYSSYSEKEEEDFIWPFEKFIQFLEDFKKFVSENQ